MTGDVDKVAPGKKEQKGMNDAVNNTEAIRNWDEHKIPIE
jgi:hypothetical protein